MSALLRSVTSADASQILEIYGPFCGRSGVSFETEPPLLAEMIHRIETLTQTYPWLVCEIDGKILGYVYAGAHRQRTAYQWSVEVTVYIREGCRRCGVGRSLYTALFGLLRAQGFFKAYAGITLPNSGSVGLHERMGFEPIGIYRNVGYTAGQWHDVGWWELTLQPAVDPPPEPKPITAVPSVAWQQAIERGMAQLNLPQETLSSAARDRR